MKTVTRDVGLRRESGDTRSVIGITTSSRPKTVVSSANDPRHVGEEQHNSGELIVGQGLKTVNTGRLSTGRQLMPVVTPAGQVEGEDETETVVTGLFSTQTVGRFKLKGKRGKN